VAASSVPIAGARSVSAEPGGGYLFVDERDDLVREVSPSGVVTTVAGTTETLPNQTVVPLTTDAPDGSIATDSGLDQPVAVSALPDGSFLVTEYGGCRVRLVSPGGPGVSTITTVAGIPPDPNDLAATGCTSATNPYAATGAATSMSLDYPTDAEPTPDGGVLIADTYNDAVRYVTSVQPGATMTTLAGGPPGSGLCSDATTDCDGQAAGNVQLDLPDSVSALQDGSGGFLVAEYAGDAVREVSGESPLATFSTVAGTAETPGHTGDGGPATAALLSHPEGVTSLAGGGFLIADTDNDVIRQVDSSGNISTIAGDGQASLTGDGGPATAASLSSPTSVSLLPNGNLLIADLDDNRIREITSAAVSMISFNPPTPNGANGWYAYQVIAVVTATQKAKIQCVLDPTVVPTVYGAIQPGCPFTGHGGLISTNGIHTIYAASQNSFGDQENPVSVTVKVDFLPPTITCNAPPSFPYGTPNAIVTATLNDSVSGPQAEALADTVATDVIGPQNATFTGSNNAGRSVTVSCPYTVTPVALSPTAPIADYSARAAVKTTTVRRLIIRGIPAGAAVQVTCTGHGCPFKVLPTVATQPCSTCAPASPPEQMVDLTRLFRRAHLAAQAMVAVSITKYGFIGQYLRFVARGGTLTASAPECLIPGVPKPQASCVIGNPVSAGGSLN
jgi:hypothetical protein